MSIINRLLVYDPL